MFLGGNLLILLVLFLALRIYDTRFRAPAVQYDRPIVEMEKTRPAENPYFDNFDRMALFSQYRGTRAVGSENPDKMVILIAHSSYERYLHFSHLLYEAYKRKIGLVILDFSNVRHFIPLGEGEKALENSERMVLFARTMIAYMEQYGFTEFRVAYLGLSPPDYMTEGLSPYAVKQISGALPEGDAPLSMAEEVTIIDSVLSFQDP